VKWVEGIGVENYPISCIILKVVALQNTYMVAFFDKGDELSKKVWIGQEWKSKLQWKSC